MIGRDGRVVADALPEFAQSSSVAHSLLDRALLDDYDGRGQEESASTAPQQPVRLDDLRRLRYQHEAEAFERSLGNYLSQHPRAVAEVAKFTRLLWERTPAVQRPRWAPSRRSCRARSAVTRGRWNRSLSTATSVSRRPCCGWGCAAASSRCC
ncbi:hypothetical protein NKH77_28735 [Streptomyces sp. M19]